MQMVNLGKTQSGIHGVFTGGMLVLPLTELQYNLYKADPVAFAAYCKRNRFAPA